MLNIHIFTDTYAKLLNECCVAMIYDDSCEVIVNLIRMSGRDYEWSGVIQLCVSILHTLAKVIQLLIYFVFCWYA